MGMSSYSFSPAPQQIPNFPLPDRGFSRVRSPKSQKALKPPSDGLRRDNFYVLPDHSPPRSRTQERAQDDPVGSNCA